jgi:hypothetical protein
MFTTDIPKVDSHFLLCGLVTHLDPKTRHFWFLLQKPSSGGLNGLYYVVDDGISIVFVGVVIKTFKLGFHQMTHHSIARVIDSGSTTSKQNISLRGAFYPLKGGGSGKVTVIIVVVVVASTSPRLLPRRCCGCHMSHQTSFSCDAHRNPFTKRLLFDGSVVGVDWNKISNNSKSL